MPSTLHYIHDPMCSWCWGYRPALAALLAGLPTDVQVVRLLGGLAPDSDAPMPAAMQSQLQQIWRHIQTSIPNTRFNFEFWARCAPRRSTWPACRAVIAARRQDVVFDRVMTDAIQRAYYLEARNPSDRQTLIALAAEIGADSTAFAVELDAQLTQQILDAEIAQARALGVSAFPSLVLTHAGYHWPVPVEYTDPGATLDTIARLRQ